ncbi:MAG: Translation initiation factor 2 subunit alpha [Candidatus Woesearchaeota archaeon]|nr:Translation initiation factor 2 subunit alpha [Candidatus Woesearchaeota archaeon]
MLYRRHGLPEENEIVLSTVTSVKRNCVFVFLDEYKIDGLIHISEVSAGRIRNIRDYVKKGKKVVCKILRVKHKRRQVDLSLRRVNDSQRRNKINALKQEQKAEKIVEYVSKLLDKDTKKLYKEITKEIFEKYSDLNTFFQDIVAGESSFSDFKVDKTVAEKIEEIVKQRFKPQQVQIGGVLHLTSYKPDGVSVIKKTLKKASLDNVELRYKGSGDYFITVKAPDYKKAESILEKAKTAAIEHITSTEGIGSFTRK